MNSPLDHILVSAFLENVPDFVYFKDSNSRFIAVSASKARRHGLAPADLVGKTDSDIFAGKHAQRTAEDEQTIMRTGVPILGKLEKIVWPDGRETWALSSKLPLRDKDGAIVGTFGLSADVTESKRMEMELEKARKDLIDASRLAGMAEVATGVLHNVGNVLNTLNVSASIIGEGLRHSKAESLAKLAALMREHASDLGHFITQDPKGRLIPDFIETLSRHFLEERARMTQELELFQKNLDHIKEIVSMQQAYATMAGISEAHEPAVLLEDALRMNSGALLRHEVKVVRDFKDTPKVLAEKGKVLQILINLIRNAKYATDDSGRQDKVIWLRTERGGPGMVRLIVQDNGVGIPEENLTRIFGHGFTTRTGKGGHGFGLHSSALAAKEMRGSLTVLSGGKDTGATFVVELPEVVDPNQPAA